MSLISTYNSIKSLLVTKLTNKGVSNVNTSQGMTTLIGKIDDIENTFSTTIDGEDITGVYPPNVNVPISSSLKLVYENDDDVSVSAPLQNADVIYTFVGANNYYTNTVTTDSNGVASMNFNTPHKDTYTVLVNFLESRPFQAVSDFALCTLTIFESIIKYFQNISFTNSDGTNSREIIYGNNQSITMTVQSFEEDEITPSIGSQVDYLLLTNPTINISYENTYTLIYDRTVGGRYDVYSCRTGENEGMEDGTYILPFEPNNGSIDFYDQDYNIFCTISSAGEEDEFYCDIYNTDDDMVIQNKIKINNNTLTVTNLDGEEYTIDNTIYNFISEASTSLVIQKEIINTNYDEQKFTTLITDNQGLSSYEYEAQGIGEIYIKAQSHDDPTIQTDSYLISDWVKKDFTGVGNWIAFTGRVNTFSSNTDTTFTQGNGSKGGVHSQNTIFHLPNDDYIVSFKVANGTIGIGVRVGLHSASYDDHHEKAVIGIENDSSGGFKFDYSTSEVTTVTKVNTNINKLNTDDLIEFRVVDDTVTFHINGTQYASATLDWLHTPMWLYGQSWSTNNGNFSIKDFRVKRIIND